MRSELYNNNETRTRGIVERDRARARARAAWSTHGRKSTAGAERSFYIHSGVLHRQPTMAQSQAFEATAEAIAGSIGGFISSAVLFPLDYVKTQQQAGTVKGSFLTVAVKIWKEKGLLAFYSGAPWRGFQSGYEKIIYFYLFAFARNAYVKRFGALDPIMNLVIGYVSNWCQLPLTMPVDTCVNGMITTGKSFGTMVKTVIDNPAGAYKGMAAYSIAALKPAVQFTVVEQMRFRLIAANVGTQYEGGLSSSQVRVQTLHAFGWSLI